MRSSRLMDSLIHWASCEVPRSVPALALIDAHHPEGGR